MPAQPQDIIGFWRSAGPAKWFAKNANFDDVIRLKFEAVHHAAARGQYDDWCADPEGALALILLLDQFPRNLYRKSAHALATDPMALKVARQAVARGFDVQIEAGLRAFVYMPLEHSEDLEDQEACVQLMTRLEAETGDGEPLRYAMVHLDVIARFGRFPHRNPALARETTPAERAFLEDGGFSG